MSSCRRETHPTKTCQTADATSVAEIRSIEKDARDAGQNKSRLPVPTKDQWRRQRPANARPKKVDCRIDIPMRDRVKISPSTTEIASGNQARPGHIATRTRSLYTGVALNHAIMAPITINHARNTTLEMQCLKDRSAALFCLIEHL